MMAAGRERQKRTPGRCFLRGFVWLSAHAILPFFSTTVFLAPPRKQRPNPSPSPSDPLSCFSILLSAATSPNPHRPCETGHQCTTTRFCPSGSEINILDSRFPKVAALSSQSCHAATIPGALWTTVRPKKGIIISV
jgi:hypothetical protein